jgi:histidinol dehydrogenase
MINIYNNPTNWVPLLQRPLLETKSLETTVQGLLQRIKREGDSAVRDLTARFDGAVLDNLELSDSERATAIAELDPQLREAIDVAYDNIRQFHSSQRAREQRIETTIGITCWRKNVAIERVGLYIPGGTAPLFSTVLMLGVPAQLAGCKTQVLCTPPSKEGKIHPAIVYAASLVGCRQLFKIGGVQAIGAMAYGTETVPQVYKIFGPGNQYVTCAKQIISQQGTAIDLPAGPSELLVWADAAANADFVAADLLSQAEHGADSQVVLVSDDRTLLEKVQQALSQQIASLPRADIARAALANSRAILLEQEEALLQFINDYAPEHLIINTKEAERQAEQIINAGSIFIGAYTPESLGDYASGTNHTLPTNGYARQYSGVSLDDFVKKITLQKATAKGLQNIAWVVETMAAAEQLTAHQRAVSIRVAALQKDNKTTPAVSSL